MILHAQHVVLQLHCLVVKVNVVLQLFHRHALHITKLARCQQGQVYLLSGVIITVARPAHPLDPKKEAFMWVHKLVASIIVVYCHRDLRVMGEHPGYLVCWVLCPGLLKYRPELIALGWRYHPPPGNRP